MPRKCVLGIFVDHNHNKNVVKINEMFMSKQLNNLCARKTSVHKKTMSYKER